MEVRNEFDIAQSMYAPKSADASVKLPAEKLMQMITPETTEADRRKVKDQVNALKRKLPVVIPLAHFTNGHRAVEEPINYTMSPWSMLDVDGVDDPDKLWENDVKPRVDELHIVWVFKTPSTKGLKLMYLRPDGMDEAESQKWMAGKLGLPTYDVSCKNIARIHYLVSRKYCYIIDMAQMFDPNLTNKGYQVDVSQSPSDTSAPSKEAEEVAETIEVAPEQSLEYLGVPYSEYEETYWEVNHDGRRPCPGDRDTLTFEIACALRHITGFDANLLDRIIPCYSGFTEEEKRKCINNAVNFKRGPMPRKMQLVIDTIKRRHADRPDLIQALDDLEEQDASYSYSAFEECFTRQGKKFPMGITDSFDGIQTSLRMPMLIAIGPMIATLATGVRLKVHNELGHLNLIAYVVGDAASGKSKADQLFQLWMYRLIQADNINLQIMADWKALPKKKREQTPRPVIQVRIQPLRCSMADVLDHLNNADGKHLYSFTAEADQLTQSNRSGAFANVSVLVRQSYDGSEYRSSYAGENAVNANIEHVLWNMTLCTTPDGLRRAMPNVTNGELTRLAIASTPDNTYAPLVLVNPRTDKSKDNIKRIAPLLELMEGDIDLPMLEEQSNKWLESVRLSSLMNGDSVRARQRFRVAVTAMRYVCCLMLCAYAEWLLSRLDNRGRRALPKWAHGAETAEKYLKSHPTATSTQVPKLFQTEEYLAAYDVLADYLLDNILYYFRQKLTTAYGSDDYKGVERKRTGENDSVYARLPKTFTIEQARQERGDDDANDNAARQMVKNWKRQGLVAQIGRGVYCKLM